jgi:hypothetical protein
MATEKQKGAARRNLEMARSAQASRRKGRNHQPDQMADRALGSSRGQFIDAGQPGEQN